MNSIASVRPRQYRTIWISDVHLGTRGCKAELLLDFLKHNDSETLYLVGDIVDGWRLRKSWYWPQTHNDLVQKVLRRARKGCRVIYVPGNHDELFRNYTDLHLGGIEILAEAIHETADGRRLLVLHGDQFDAVVKWVEENKAPDTLTATVRRDQTGPVVRSRPLCPYPLVARYKGRGSTDEAVNFECKAGF